MVDPYQALQAERHALCDLFAELEPNEWDQPSLCTGWRVRDVAAHASLLVSIPRWRLVAGVLARRGDVNRYMAATVPRRGDRSISSLRTDLQQLVGSGAIAPLGRPVDSAIDAFIHQLDVAVPLNRPIRNEPSRLRWMADGMVGAGGAIGSRQRVAGLRLVATDISWHYGTGPEIVGPVSALLLAGCGRAALDHELDGPGRSELIGRR